MPQLVTSPEARTLLAAVIFALSYLVFAVGKFPGLKVDRPGAAIIGAVAMVASGVVAPREVLGLVDFSTLVLLYAMMIIVAFLQLSGFIEWSAEVVLRVLHPAHLLPAVILSSGVLSAFFVNDVVCLVMVPFVLTITRRMALAPMPYLLAVATASNIGSVATITGNPQNILVGSYSGIGYTAFLSRLGPVALAGLALDWAILHAIFLRGRPSPEPPRTLALPWPDLSRMAKPVAVAAAVVVGFFLGAPPALVAALGAAVLLVSRTIEPRVVHEQVDWSLLVFFVGLFLVVGGAERAGITGRLLDLALRLEVHRPAVFTAATAVLSNLVSNVPAVMLLKSLVPGFADPRTAWLLLAMASTLAGNLTITGSVANIIVVQTARDVVHIGFRDYLRVGVPITLATLVVGWAWLAFGG